MCKGLGYSGFVDWIQDNRNIPLKDSIRDLQLYAIENNISVPYVRRVRGWYDRAVKEGIVKQDETPVAYVKAVISNSDNLDYRALEKIAETMDLHVRSLVEGFNDFLPDDLKHDCVIRGVVGVLEQGKIDDWGKIKNYIEKTAEAFSIEADSDEIMAGVFNEFDQ